MVCEMKRVRVSPANSFQTLIVTKGCSTTVSATGNVVPKRTPNRASNVSMLSKASVPPLIPRLPMLVRVKLIELDGSTNQGRLVPSRFW